MIHFSFITFFFLKWHQIRYHDLPVSLSKWLSSQALFSTDMQTEENLLQKESEWERKKEKERDRKKVLSSPVGSSLSTALVSAAACRRPAICSSLHRQVSEAARQLIRSTHAKERPLLPFISWTIEQAEPQQVPPYWACSAARWSEQASHASQTTLRSTVHNNAGCKARHTCGVCCTKLNLPDSYPRHQFLSLQASR